MKFFKKKKSDTTKDLGEMAYEPPTTLISVTDAPVQTMSSTALVMPKPRKFLTPTRAILSRFDGDKTLIEEYDNEKGMIYPQRISPILKPPAADQEEDILLLNNRLLNEDEQTMRALEGAIHYKKSLPSIPFKKAPKNAMLLVQHETANSTKEQPDAMMDRFRFYSSQEDIERQNEQEQLLQDLRKQIERMEQQRIQEREEWKRKEQELLEKRQHMMDTLQQTKEQLDQILRERTEVYYREDEAPEEAVSRRTVNKSRSEEHLRIRHHHEKSVSRKSSLASTKSGVCLPSPSSTLVPTPHYYYPKRRSRARSMDWHDGKMVEELPMYSPYQQDIYYNYPDDDDDADEEEEEGLYAPSAYYNKWQPPPVYYHPRPPVDYNRLGYGGLQQSYIYN